MNEQRRSQKYGPQKYPQEYAATRFVRKLKSRRRRTDNTIQKYKYKTHRSVATCFQTANSLSRRQ